MDKLIPWNRLESIIEPHYPKAGKGRRPYPLSTMLRIHCMQQWYSLSDPAMEDALYEIASMRLFAGLSLDKPIPDHTTVMNFRHLLERKKLARKIFKEVNQWLTEAGVLLKEGTLMDATIIEAPTSTMNKSGERDPEMYQTKKGNQWHFGLKAHIGVDARTGITHSFTTTPAHEHEHDLNQAGQLLHGDEQFIFADAGYRGAEKRAELKSVTADWHISERPGKIRALKKHPRKNKVPIRTEYLKASVRAKVEHPFRIIKCQFGFVKTHYRGLLKNDSKLAMLFALAKIVRVSQLART
ncbi:MAG: IS5 family transposase [Oceanospirillaceae bacterium]|nr:IS5 family transposase [Oceanospirillaceae bacterium]